MMKSFGPYSMTQLGALQKPDKLILDYKLRDSALVPNVRVIGTLANGCNLTVINTTALKSCEGGVWITHVFDLKQSDIISIVMEITNYERFKRFKEATLTFKTTGVVQATKVV